MGLAKLEYYKLHDDVIEPDFATSGSACFDLRAHLQDWDIIKAHGNEFSGAKDGVFRLSPGARALVPTGIVFSIPKGYSIRLHPRSGLAFKRGLTLSNCEGIIDSDYVEEVFVSVINQTQDVISIEHGERIAQAEMIKTNYYIIRESSIRPERTTRDGGFGSTGTG